MDGYIITQCERTEFNTQHKMTQGGRKGGKKEKRKEEEKREERRKGREEYFESGCS